MLGEAMALEMPASPAGRLELEQIRVVVNSLNRVHGSWLGVVLALGRYFTHWGKCGDLVAGLADVLAHRLVILDHRAAQLNADQRGHVECAQVDFQQPPLDHVVDELFELAGAARLDCAVVGVEAVPDANLIPLFAGLVGSLLLLLGQRGNLEGDGQLLWEFTISTRLGKRVVFHLGVDDTHAVNVGWEDWPSFAAAAERWLFVEIEYHFFSFCRT